jgi:NAD(P)-dependent dehydrogenase (short-subunit alcohol dehydrogenase family)
MSDRLAAIVTGASRGIGRAIAKDLAEPGYDTEVGKVMVAVQRE